MVIGLFKTLLIIAIIYYAWKFVWRLIGPFLAKFAMSKIQKKMEEQMRQASGGASGQQGRSNPRGFDKRPEGEITLEKKKKSNKQKMSTKDMGEYVEFEDVD